MHPGERLGDVFESRPNALNAIRLGLALTVIVWHSYAIGGSTYLPSAPKQLLSELPVDGFFAISGFLICRAWHRRPQLRHYLAARARRILPGLWVCLLVTAFVIAPLGVAAAGQSGLSVGEQVRFVLFNASTWQVKGAIDGGPVGVPFTSVWNGSLWSLGYEALCYLVVASLGVLGLLGRRRVVVAVAASFWVLAMALVVSDAPFTQATAPLFRGSRTGIMFACGALLWAYRDRIPMRRNVALGCVALVGWGAFLPDYRLVAAPALAYLMLWLGMRLGQHPRLVLTNDLSYGTYVYAFPIQQALLLAGGPHSWLPFAVLSIAATLPLAAASWFVVEKPILRSKRGQIAMTPEPVPVS